MARLEIAVLIREFTPESDTAADTSAEGVIDVLVIDVASFGEGGEISVVFDESRELKILLELVGDIERLPGEIAEPGGAVIFHDARHGDAKGNNIGHNEVDVDLLKEKFVEFLLIDRGLELDGMKDFASRVHEGNDSFGAANVDTEIHNSIIQHIIPLMAIA